MLFRNALPLFRLSLSLAVAAAGWPVLHAAAQQPSNASDLESRPNVVVIMIDTMRTDYLDLYGYDRQTAPFLNWLAQHSTHFPNAFSTSSWTAPATASLFTALYPTQHSLQIGLLYQQWLHNHMLVDKVEENDPKHEELKARLDSIDKPAVVFQKLPKEFTTLTEIFQQSGYTTYGIAANINISPDMNFDQGFDTFHFKDQMPAQEIYEHVVENTSAIKGDKPYFLYVHFMDPHEPYTTRYPYFIEQSTNEENMKEAYLSEIRYMDDYIALMFHHLRMDQNTLVVVVTDHGEEFLDHGRYGHKPQLYGELNDALTLFYGPSMGITAQAPIQNVSLIDVMPTVLDLVNMNEPDHEMAGVSLTPILQDTAARGALERTLAERTLFAHRVRPAKENLQEIWAAIHGDRKLIVDEDGDIPMQLFDLISDPGEQRNLVADEPEAVKTLEASLDEFRAQERHSPDIGMEILDEELQDTLEALGYIE